MQTPSPRVCGAKAGISFSLARDFRAPVPASGLAAFLPYLFIGVSGVAIMTYK
jgi:hypothetical protein